jgi:ATP-dependent Clp endopeptidase proteolytic subunit ClpP
MKAVIYIKGVIGEDTDLFDVIRQYKSFDNVDEVEVNIDSEGGYVESGMDIFNYLRKLNKPITTKAVKAYSIAASVFMAGDTRLLEDGSQRFMIHMPFGMMQGNAENFESAAKELRKIEKELTDFYSIYTDTDKDSIKKLLENETFMTAAEAVEMGLATGVYSNLQAVAYYNKSENKKETSMSKMKNFIKALEVLVGTGEFEIKALELQDANGDVINFPDLAENETPSEGDKIEKEGSPADGEILMPDGSKVIASEGVVSEIIEAPADEADEDEDSQASSDEDEEASADEDEKKEQAKLESLLAQFKFQVEASKEENEKKFKALNAEITELKKEMGASIDNDPQPNNTRGTKNERYSISKALNKKSK